MTPIASPTIIEINAIIQLKTIYFFILVVIPEQANRLIIKLKTDTNKNIIPSINIDTSRQGFQECLNIFESNEMIKIKSLQKLQ